MSGLAVGNLIDFSWKKTKEILFPFQFKRWLKILLIVWLAGQGVGGNFNIPNRFKPSPEQTQTQSVAQGSVQGHSASESGQTTTGETAPSDSSEQQKSEQLAQEAFAKLGPWLFVLISGFILIALLFMWLSARFQFIFLEVLMRRDIAIGESFRNYKTQGNSFFLWSLGFMAVLLGGLALVVLPGVLLKAPAWLFIAVPFLFLALMGAAVIGMVVLDFVTPIMYRDGIRTMEAVKKFLRLKPNIGSLFLYVLIKIGLGILGFLISFLVIFGAGLLVLLGALLVALIGAALAAIAPFLKSFLLILGAVLLVFAVLMLVVLLGLVTLPLPVFFRTFSLSFLAYLLPEYNLLNIPSADSGA